MLKSNTKDTERFLHIDFLRAICIIVVIATHVLSNNFTPGIVGISWNYLHFAVVGFVFCSGYVLYAKYRYAFTTFSSIFKWYKKRIRRLLIPFYFYLIIHFSLWFLFPKLFSGLGLKISSSFFLQSVFLTGGVDLNWLVLLFLQLTFIFPLFIIGLEKRPKLFHVFVFAAFVTTLFFTVWQFPYSQYRFVMWIPWSVVLYSSFLFFEKKLSLVRIAGISGVLFLVLFWIFSILHRSLVFIDHKYPPDFFYLSYASFMTTLVLFISNGSFLQTEKIKTWYTFISQEAYALYFIHYIVLDFILTQKKTFVFLQNIPFQLLLVFVFSIFISFLLKKALQAIY